MAGSRKSNSGCLSSVLRHLLCSSSISTYSSTEVDNHAPIEKEKLGDEVAGAHGEEVLASSSDRPGIVARLMGLETLPADPSRVPKFWKSPKHVPRSRSVNFMDYLTEIDFRHVPDTCHRRVRTSVSFREEVPNLPGQHGRHHHRPDLLVLYLDELEENKSRKGSRAKSSGPESGPGDRKQKDKRRERVGKEREASKLRNEPRRVSQEEAKQGRKNGNQRGKLIQEKEVMAESKFTKKRKEGRLNKRVAIVPVESDGSEASSPISVLNLDDDWVNEQGISTVQARSPAKVQEYVNMMSPKKDKDCSSPPSKFLPPAWISDSFERRGISKKEALDPLDSPYVRQETDYCLSVAMEVYRLTEEEIVKNSIDWVRLTSKEEDFCKLCEEISAFIEHRVLEQVVRDLCAT